MSLGGLMKNYVEEGYLFFILISLLHFCPIGEVCYNSLELGHLLSLSISLTVLTRFSSLHPTLSLKKETLNLVFRSLFNFLLFFKSKFLTMGQLNFIFFHEGL